MVDTRTEVPIQEAMARLRQGRTSFVIAHRLSTIRNASTFVVMDAGRMWSRALTPSSADAVASTTACTPASLPSPSPRRQSYVLHFAADAIGNCHYSHLRPCPPTSTALLLPKRGKSAPTKKLQTLGEFSTELASMSGAGVHADHFRIPT
jgi:hypothetical protein